MQTTGNRLDLARSRFRTWITADPKNLVLVLTAPWVVYETLSQLRWYRAHKVSLLSPAGTVAYMKARPVRFGLSIAVSMLPELVGLVRKRGSRGQAGGNGQAG